MQYRLQPHVEAYKACFCNKDKFTHGLLGLLEDVLSSG